ncbi:hypothetical protein [Streptomyces syringium]|uniref:hypothetical protein n=1 Tax=Streptomyces syringium TaxID=76729 RepID=UPI0033BB8605
MTAPTTALALASQTRGLDTLYPQAAWELPVNPALPAPRRADPPVERCNLGGYRDYYDPNIVREFPVQGERERLAVIDKAFPHSLYDVMLLVARDDVIRQSVSDTPAPVLAALLRAARTFMVLLSDPVVLRRFGLDGGRVTVSWNHDPTLDRDNGQWWDKRMHWHLNCWPSFVQRTVAPVRLADVTDVTMRRSLVDPAAYLAHRVMTDALRDAALPGGCRLMGPDPVRDAERALPIGLKIRIPGWGFVPTLQCQGLLRTLHDTASDVYRSLHQCFTGSDDMPAPWQRPRLLHVDDVEHRLDGLVWLSPAARSGLTRLRRVLRDVTPGEMRLLAARRGVANRCLTLGGLSYNLALFTPELARADRPVIETNELYVVMQFKLVSFVGNSPAIGGAAASVIDRMGGPVMTPDDHARRSDFQHQYTELLQRSLPTALRAPEPPGGHR